LPSRPTIVAIVLNYRTARQTIAAVRSLQQSQRRIDRVIVVDNASGDDSVSRLARELEHVGVLRTPRNNGFAAGCNAGLREALQAGGDLLLVLNPDVLVRAAAIPALEEAILTGADVAAPVLVSHPDCGRIESCGMTYSSLTGRMRHRFAGDKRSTLTLPDLADVDAVSGCAMLIRREVFETVGLFAEEYFYGFEDLEFCLRAKAAGFRIVCAGSALVEHEGAASIGPSSPRRLYFAARNHLLLASRFGPQGWPIRTARAANIVALNVAHAMFRSSAPVGEGLAAVRRGVRDHFKGKYGPDEDAAGGYSTNR
jgi:GT2 family glycosyltransferase